MSSVGASSGTGGPPTGEVTPVGPAPVQLQAPEAEAVALDSEGKQAAPGPGKQRWTPKEALANMLKMKQAGRAGWWKYLKPILARVGCSFVLCWWGCLTGCVRGFS